MILIISLDTEYGEREREELYSESQWWAGFRVRRDWSRGLWRLWPASGGETRVVERAQPWVVETRRWKDDTELAGSFLAASEVKPAISD
jgi:hypothetical protein